MNITIKIKKKKMCKNYLQELYLKNNNLLKKYEHFDLKIHLICQKIVFICIVIFIFYKSI